MTIARRLLILVAVPLLALLGLGWFTRVELADIDARTRFVAEKQIASLVALAAIDRSFVQLRVGVRNHLLGAAGEDDRFHAEFAADKAEFIELLDTYSDTLVTDAKDRRLLDEFRAASHEYIAGAEDVIATSESGKRDEAAAQMFGPMAEISTQLERVTRDWIGHHEGLAREAGQAAVAAIEEARKKMLWATGIVLALSGLLGLLTVRRVVHPMRALQSSVEGIAAGDFDLQVPFTANADEIGALARSIGVLKQGAAAMNEQRWLKAHEATLGVSLQRTTSLKEFGQTLVSDLVPLLGGGVAGLYILEDDGQRIRRIAGFGLGERALSVERFWIGEGLAGQCARERKPLALAEPPPAYLEIVSGLGKAPPVQVGAWPLLSQDTLVAVLEFASFRALQPRETALLEELLPMAAMSMAMLQRTLRSQELLEQLREQNLLADSALELTKSGYWHVPLDGSGWYNSSERAAKIFGDLPSAGHRYSLDEWAAHVREGDEVAAAATMENFAAACAGTIPAYDSVYAYKRPIDGRVVWIHALGQVAKDADGKPESMYGVAQDVTDFKQLETELVRAREKAEGATEMKSMFLANMSHEIRTPMNAIIGLSHLALKTQLTAKQRDYVGKVHNAGTSLLGIINDILDFSKIEAGKLDLESTPFQIDEVLASVTTLTAQKAHEKGLEFLADVAPAIPQNLIGDPLRLGQILTNLVNNAVKFTETGEIRLKIETQEHAGDKVQLKFSVRDTGIGMTPEQSSKLFQAFTQADMSTTRKHGGTGLGLTISRRLVEMMGGQIWIESEAGVGSTFLFTAWLELGAATTAGRVLPERLPSLRVLVVDDNSAAREILAEALGDVTAHVDVVASGAEAVAAVRQQDVRAPYDVVFMDWRMPGMDGLQATRRIKVDESLQRQPAIVMVTAFGREEVREEAERLGIDGFLVKPVTKSMLVDTLITLFAPTAEETSEAAARDPNRDRLAGARILLAEDNAINQQIAVELLEGVGAHVTVADNGKLAVQAVQRDPTAFDLVLMDLQMPELDGYQATIQLRAAPSSAQLPIIAMTAHATIEERQRCLAAGMVDHISKPIDPDALFDTIARHFQPQPTRDAKPVAAPSTADAAATSDPLALPDVPDLDCADGLMRVAGNRKLYLKLLRQFATQEADAPERIAAQLRAGERDVAERSAHTIKGVAANLGAKTVQHAAGELETAVHDGVEAARIEALRVQLAAVLTPLIDGLRSALGDAPAVSPTPGNGAAVDPARVKAVVAQMHGYLAEFDASAAECLEENRDLFASLFAGDGFARFEKLVQDYSFADAQAQLQQASVPVTEEG